MSSTDGVSGGCGTRYVQGWQSRTRATSWGVRNRLPSWQTVFRSLGKCHVCLYSCRVVGFTPFQPPLSRRPYPNLNSGRVKLHEVISSSSFGILEQSGLGTAERNERRAKTLYHRCRFPLLHSSSSPPETLKRRQDFVLPSWLLQRRLPIPFLPPSPLAWYDVGLRYADLSGRL